MRKTFTLIICTLFFVLNIFIVSASTTISDIIVERQTKFFDPGFKSYEVILYNADSTGVRFSINGQLTKLLNKGDFYIISEVNISVNDIQRELGGTYIVNFTIHIAGCHTCDFGISCQQDNCCNGKEIKEIDFTSDNENCGSCNNKCSSGTKCDNGNCLSTEIKNDLSDYPYFLINDGKWDLTTVVGDKSSAINVIAQTYILSSFLGARGVKNKLASEITDLNQNIISIGNPCVNDITAKIMNNPEPCDKDFERGKAHIRLYKNNGFFHLVVAGYTDLGTKKAAEILANYLNDRPQGVTEFSGDTGDRLIEEKKEEAPKTEATEQEQSKKIETEIKTETEPKTDIQAEPRIEQKAMENKKTEEKVEPKEEEPKQTEKSGNIINKLISWLFSLFKK